MKSLLELPFVSTSQILHKNLFDFRLTHRIKMGQRFFSADLSYSLLGA
tara:strand:- start:3360 stop:3503 length:144 start_codon:yes stop_codon:yes gene_type:complete